jgi:hypothetical protein
MSMRELHKVANFFHLVLTLDGNYGESINVDLLFINLC